MSAVYDNLKWGLSEVEKRRETVIRWIEDHQNSVDRYTTELEKIDSDILEFKSALKEYDE